MLTRTGSSARSVTPYTPVVGVSMLASPVWRSQEVRLANPNQTAFAVTVPDHLNPPATPGTDQVRRTPCPTARVVLLPGFACAVSPVELLRLTGTTA